MTDAPLTTIAEAIEAVHAKGWAIEGLGYTRHDAVSREMAWMCRIYSAAFGRYVWIAEDGKSWGQAQAKVIGEGKSPVQAVENALKALEGSDVQALYRAFDKAWKDNLDART